MTCAFYQERCWCWTTLSYFSKRTLKKIMIILLTGSLGTLVSKFLCLRYSVKNRSAFWQSFFSRRHFLRIAASIPGLIQGLLFPQLEMFVVWMEKCSLKTESKVLWNRSYASSASSLINTGFQIISCNEFLQFDKFSSEKIFSWLILNLQLELEISL